MNVGILLLYTLLSGSLYTKHIVNDDSRPEDDTP